MSRYLEAFKKAAVEAKDCFELVGSLMIVEVMPEEEFKTKSGLVLASSASTHQINGLQADKPTFARVLMVGQGIPDADGNIECVDLDPGDIVLLPATSIKKFSVFGKLVNYGDSVIGLSQTTEIQKRFKGQKGFDEFFATLNQALVEARTAESSMATGSSGGV